MRNLLYLLLLTALGVGGYYFWQKGFNLEFAPKVVANAKACRFENAKWPTEMVVLGVKGEYDAGEELPFVNASGTKVRKIGLAINYDKPVALVLARNGPTIWNIGWAKSRPNVIAVFANGAGARQLVTGLPVETPILDAAYNLPELNPDCKWAILLSGHRDPTVFHQAEAHFGRKMDIVFPVNDKSALIGKELSSGDSWVTNPEPSDQAAMAYFDWPKNVRRVVAVPGGLHGAQVGLPMPPRPPSIDSRRVARSNLQVTGKCKFGKIPDDADVYAVAGQAGDVKVSVSIRKPGYLILSNDHETFWHIGKTERSKILGVVAMGYSTHTIKGLSPEVPVLFSNRANDFPCGNIKIRPKRTEQLNRISNQIFGRPVRAAFRELGGSVLVTDDIQPEPHSLIVKKGFVEANQSSVAPARQNSVWGLLTSGAIRLAGSEDLKKLQRALGAKGKKIGLSNMDIYVVSRAMVIPDDAAGKSNVAFIVPKGVSVPVGDRGKSRIFDYNKRNICDGGC
ncbi:MAG: hypothetical protein AB7F86_17420 [Bdellovibrionales bacterium]